MIKNIKNIFYIIMGFILNINFTLAEDADGIFGDAVTKDKVRTGDIHIDDIPNILRTIIDLLLEISGTIAIIFVIVGAYKILFGSLTSEKTKGKDTIIMALTGFAIATLAWFIIKFLIDNFS